MTVADNDPLDDDRAELLAAWSAAMTVELGSANAKTIADNHEYGDTETDQLQVWIDLENNHVGRRIGRSAPGPSTRRQYGGRGGAYVTLDYSGSLAAVAERYFSALDTQLTYLGSR